MFNRKENTIVILNSENKELKSRVKELEETLCPFNKHNYVIIDTYEDNYMSFGEVYYYTVRILQCKRCKKIIKDNNRFGEYKYQVTE